MSDRSAYFGQGAQLQISDMAVTPVFTTIHGVGSISGPGMTRDTIDTTSHSSPGGRREYIGGLRDSDEVTADINWVWDDPGQTALEDAYDGDDPVTFRIVYPFTELNETDEFTGIVTSLSKATPIDDKVTASLTIKITGAVTRTNDETP